MTPVRLSTCLVFVFCLGSGAACAAAALELTRESPGVLLHAEYVLSDSATPPPASSAWQPVELPDNWRHHARHLQGIAAWYRFPLPDAPPAEPTSLYLWRFSMNAEAWVNDERI